MKFRKCRSLSIITALALCLSLFPMPEVQAQEAALDTCPHHLTHTEECGYTETQDCAFVCDICGGGVSGGDNTENPKESSGDVDTEKETDEGQEQVGPEDILTVNLADSASEQTVSADYQKADWNGSAVVYTEETADSCSPVADSTEAVTWETGWYVVNGEVTASEPITVSGEVNLILADGCTLNAQKGIVVTTGNSLTIYAQSAGSGTLTATGEVETQYDVAAGIGGGVQVSDSGAVTIHGGVICAVGGSGGRGYCGAAGIGGASHFDADGGNSGAVTIYGGTITASSGEGNATGAGIGGGAGKTGGAGSNITIYDGTVTARADSTGSAGIGGGQGWDSYGGEGSNIHIYGGTVKAIGGNFSAGIGGAMSSGLKKSGDGTNITISGGKVTAVGGQYAAGIGGGGGYQTSNQYITNEYSGGIGTNISITGGIVNAQGGEGNSSGLYAGDPIGNGGNADGEADVARTLGIIFENGVGLVYGDVTFTGIYDVPAGYSLTIPIGASLGGTGTLTGGGEYLLEELSEDMIIVPENLTYTQEDMSEELQNAVSINGDVLICGQEFHVDTTGWELHIERESALKYIVKYTHADKGTISVEVNIARMPIVLTDAAAYREDGTEADSFDAGEKIFVKAAFETSESGAIMAAADFSEPIGGQMAVYYEGVQISEPSTVEDGVHIMTVDTNDLPEEALNKEISLTVRLIESDTVSGAEASVKVTVSAVAKVTKDDAVTYYGAIESAFKAVSGNRNAFIKLLSDTVCGSNNGYISHDNGTCTLDLNGYVLEARISADNGPGDGGRLIIMDSAPGGKSGIIKAETCPVSASFNGTLTIIGGTFIGERSGARSEGGTVQLRGGTFSCIQGSGNRPVTSLLGHEGEKRYAYYDADGRLLAIQQPDQDLPGPVTVKECTHQGEGVCEYLPVEGEEKHQKHCLACDYLWEEEENCSSFTYAPIENDPGQHTVTCEDCGGERTEEHAFVRMYRTNGNVTTNWNICHSKCKYEELITTLTVNVPDFLIYGEADGRELTCTLEPELELEEMCWHYFNAQEQGRLIEISGETCLLPSDLPAGDYEGWFDAQAAGERIYGAFSFTVIPASLTEDRITLSLTDAVYNGAEQKPEVILDGLTEGTDYEIRYGSDTHADTSDYINAGTAYITVTGKGNYTGTVEKVYTIAKAAPVVAWQEGDAQELIYTGQTAEITVLPTVTLVNNEAFTGAVSYSHAKEGETTYTDGLPENAGIYRIKAHVEESVNYTGAESTNTLALTIGKAEGTLTIPEAAISKSFGDEEFSLGCSTNGDGTITYAVSASKDASGLRTENDQVITVSPEGTVQFKGAGTAEIRVSLAEGANYTGAASQIVTVSVAKADAPKLALEVRKYTCSVGSRGEVAIEVADKLPDDCGAVQYSLTTVDDDDILADVSVDEKGTLVYTVKENKNTAVIGNTAAITVNADTANYESTAYTLNIELVEHKTVELQEGSRICVNGGEPVVYGQTLSGITIDSAVFVEQGTDIVVEGTLTWKDGSVILEVGTMVAEWIFTPQDKEEYMKLTGTLKLEVQKAKNAPNMPGSAMTATVGLQLALADVSLAAYADWEWENTETALPSEAGAAVTATIRYTGADRDNYQNVTREITVTMVEDPHVTIVPDKENSTRVVMYEGIREIPQALADAGLDTEEKILEALSRVVLQSGGYTKGNMATYDIELQFSTDGGKTWIAATEENFPAEGLTITIPYPATTAQSGYEFRVVHLFTHAMNGHQPGETETPEVTNTAKGIRFTVLGLSPITIAWKATGQTPGTPGATDPGVNDPGTTDPGTSTPEPTAPGTSTPGNTNAGATDNGNTNTGTSDSSNGNIASQSGEAAYAPKTGDDRHPWFWFTLLMASGVGAAAITVRKRRYTK